MLRYYELLSHISVERQKSLPQQIQTGDLHPKKAKEDLALEIVERYWGKEAASRAKEEFENIFKEKGVPEDIETFEYEWDEEDVWVPKLMRASGAVSSTSEALRLIKQGALTVNGDRADDPDRKLPRGSYLFKVGKRRFVRIVPAGKV
jgi:tyrosyl-tRNA synthetase